MSLQNSPQPRMQVSVKEKRVGKNTRLSFGKINEVLQMPNLIEVQKNSYNWFKTEGLREVFRDVAAITDFNGNLQLSFTDFKIDDTPKYTIAECKERDVTYAAPLRVTVALWNKETDEVKKSEIYMGDMPLMTESGTFKDLNNGGKPKFDEFYVFRLAGGQSRCPYEGEEYDEAQLGKLFARFREMGVGTAVITGVRTGEDEICACACDLRNGGEPDLVRGQYVKGSFHGAGDLFTAALVGKLENGTSMEEGLTTAVDLVSESLAGCIGSEKLYGPMFEQQLTAFF